MCVARMRPWLAGSLPPEWSHLRTLLMLELGNNELQGPLPTEWCDMKVRPYQANPLHPLLSQEEL